MNFDLIVIGGGTAGVLAAIKAASKKVKVVEEMPLYRDWPNSTPHHS